MIFKVKFAFFVTWNVEILIWLSWYRLNGNNDDYNDNGNIELTYMMLLLARHSLSA